MGLFKLLKNKAHKRSFLTKKVLLCDLDDWQLPTQIQRKYSVI